MRNFKYPSCDNLYMPKKGLIKNGKWTFACYITLIRIILSPLVMILLIQHRTYLGLILFLITGFTDKLDGMISRKRKEITKFSSNFDTIADMVFWIFVFTGLLFGGFIPLWSVNWIVAYLFIIALLMYITAWRNNWKLRFPHRTSARTAIVFVFIGVIFLILDVYRSFFIVLGFIIGVIALIDYIIFAKNIKNEKS